MRQESEAFLAFRFDPLPPSFFARGIFEELGRQRARRAAQRGAADAPSRAARDLGPVFAVQVLCGFWRVLNRATLPQLLPGVTQLFSFVGCYQAVTSFPIT